MNNLISSKSTNDELIGWLREFFKKVPTHPYISKSEQLVAEFKDGEFIKIKKSLALANDRLFLKECDGEIFFPPNGDAIFLLNILHIIEILANEKTDNMIIHQLFEMTKNHQFQGWISEDNDAFRFILMALACRISKVKSHTLKLDEVVSSFNKIKNYDYFGSLFCVTSRIDIDYAIGTLPDLLITLKMANYKNRGFLLDFPGRVGQDEKRWRTVAGLFKSKQLTNDIKLLHSALECYKMPARIVGLFS